MKMLIGSRAAKYHFPDFPREPKDFDYISPDTSCKSKEIDVHWNPAFERAYFKYLAPIAPPTLLYTLKFSHVFWPHYWEKTMFDVHYFSGKGVKLDEELLPLFYAEWEKTFGKKQAYLNESNDEFFSDKVKRTYIHDDLHKAVAYNEMPVYLMIKPDAEKAMVSKKMFFELDRKLQLDLCKEEINVIALERYLIPQNFSLHPKSARLSAAKDLVTKMTKGWFPRFIVENWTDIHVMNNDNNFVGKFKTALEKKQIRYEHNRVK
jgi:hypothetical protein